MTLIDLIEKEMLEDEEDREEQSDYLESAYEEVSDETKKAVDKCFIALCGWKLKTLISGVEES